MCAQNLPQKTYGACDLEAENIQGSGWFSENPRELSSERCVKRHTLMSVDAGYHSTKYLKYPKLSMEGELITHYASITLC